MPSCAKFLTLLTLPVLLAACGGSATPAETTATEAAPQPQAAAPAETAATPTAATATVAADTAGNTLTETDFVAISAEIVCLIQNNAGTDPKQLEAQAQAIVASHGSTEAAYDAYQASLPEATRKSLSLAVIGKAGELCNFGANAAATDSATTTPAPAATGAQPLSLGGTTMPATTATTTPQPTATATQPAPLKLGN